MESLSKMLICLRDLEEVASLLGQARIFADIGEDTAFHLLHIQPGEPAESQSPEPEPPVEYEPSKSPTPEELRTAAAAAVPEIDAHRIHAEVRSGSRLVEILRYAMDNEIDLILMGRAGPGQGRHMPEGILARRVASKATCSVLRVRRDRPTHARRIIVPVRNSPCSANALETACRLAAHTGGAVCALNVFAVRSNYLKVGSTLEEHTALMRQWAERECEELLQNVNTSNVQVTVRCEPDLYLHPLPIILSHVRHSEADILVIGARGRTGAAGVLLGRVTEQLMQDSQVPVLAVKKKGECLGVLKALLTLAG